MGLQELMLMILLIFSFCSPASFAPTNFIPENTSEDKGVNRINETNTTFSSGSGSGSAMASQSKHTTSLRRGGSGGRSGGDGSQLSTSPQGGGNGLIPVYAAGAAGNRKNHKGGATTYTPCWKGGLAMLVATSAYLFLYIPS